MRATRNEPRFHKGGCAVHDRESYRKDFVECLPRLLTLRLFANASFSPHSVGVLASVAFQLSRQQPRREQRTMPISAWHHLSAELRLRAGRGGSRCFARQ